MTLRVTVLALLTALLTTSAAFGHGEAERRRAPGRAARQRHVSRHDRRRARSRHEGRGAAFQRRAGLAADGVVGPRTRAALGRRGRPRLGTRDITFGNVGWDVASLQFLLGWHGFPGGPIDGRFGARTDASLRGFQSWAGLGADGVAGRQTLAALRKPLPRSPLSVAWPLALPPGDGFGPRGARFHPGVDIPANRGTPVGAARAGWVVLADWGGSYGRLVVISHRRGVETWYAHLRRIDVSPGQHVRRGTVIGLVGSTGRSTGPHLHFEVRVRGAVTDPLRALR